MKKKLVTLLFVMCGLVIVLAGCGGKEKDVSKKDSSKEKAETSEATTGASETSYTALDKLVSDAPDVASEVSAVAVEGSVLLTSCSLPPPPA